MPDKKKQILLISYVFPPYYGIGGRRWARHTEHLAKLGYTIHVICAKNPFKKTSLWTNNVSNNSNIIVHQLPTKFPNVLVNYTPSFFQKLLYKFWITLLPLLTKSNYLDRSVFWKNVMLKKTETVIKENNINEVICTGGPFSVLYFATFLKKTFPNIFLISDWRDPWTWAPNWGYDTLSKERMLVEKNMEQLTVQNSDVVTVPTESMKVALTERYPSFAGKVKIIHHFFDKEEIVLAPKSIAKKTRLVLYGTIYINTSHFFNELAAYLAMHIDTFSLDVYTDNPSCQSIFEKHKANNVNFYSALPAKQLFAKFKDYDFVLLVHPSYGKDNVSTKFYEIIYSRTPILLISEPGLGAEFVLNNRLGYHASKGEIGKVLTQIHANKESFQYNNTYDVARYSIEQITSEIATLLESHLKSKAS